MPTTAQLYNQASHGLAGESYDADEETRPVGFEQDPDEEDAGVGYWTYADGRRVYSRGDPEEAKALATGATAAPAPEPEPAPAPAPAAEAEDDFEIISGVEDEEEPAPRPAYMRTLEQDVRAPKGEKQTLVQDVNAPRGEIVPLAAGAKPVTEPISIPETSRIAREHNNPGNLKFAGQAGAVRGEPAKDGGHWARFETPEAGAAALRSQVDLDASRGKTLGQFISGYAPPSENDTAAYTAKAAKALGARPDTPLDELDRGKVTAFIANQESSTRLPPGAAQATEPQRTQSASQSASVNVARTGSAQPFESFAQQQQRIAGAYDESIRQAEAGTAGQLDAIARRRDAIMQLAKDREASAAAAMAQRDARAQAVKDKMAEVSQRKVDINRTFKDRGALGTALGLLGVALRSRHATKFGGPNTALQQLESQRKQDIEAQVDDRNSELRSLERELGSLDAAVPVLEARMNFALAQRLDGLLQDEKSAIVQANGRNMKAALLREGNEKLAEGAKAYYGTLSRQEALTGQQSLATAFGDDGSGGGRGGRGRLTLKELAEQDQALEEQGWTDEERAAVWKRYGYEPPTGKTAAQLKREEQDKDAEAKRSEAEGKAVAASDALENFYKKAGLIRDAKTGLWKPSDEGVVPPGFAESINPFDDNAIASAGEAAVEAYGRMQSGGVIGSEERPAFRDQVGLNTGNRNQLAARANAIESTLRARLPSPERRKGTAAPAAWKAKPPEQTAQKPATGQR